MSHHSRSRAGEPQQAIEGADEDLGACSSCHAPISLHRHPLPATPTLPGSPHPQPAVADKDGRFPLAADLRVVEARPVNYGIRTDVNPTTREASLKGESTLSLPASCVYSRESGRRAHLVPTSTPFAL